MSLPPTPATSVRNVLQGIVGLLDLSTSEDTQVQIPRLYLEVWQEQLQASLALLAAPCRPSALPALVATAALAFGVGLTLGLCL
jgi:hypothetical protein